MKIALIGLTYLPAKRANTFQVMKMAQALVGAGHTVRLVVPAHPDQTARPDWDDLANHYGMEHEFQVDWFRVLPWMKRYDFGWRAYQWARSWGADVIYTRLPQSAMIASITGIPVIFEVHDLPQGRLGPTFFRLFLWGKGAKRLVVISNALARDLETRFSIPKRSRFMIVAPDGVDLNRYRDLPLPQEARRMLADKWAGKFSLSVDRFTAGYTGHLYAGRGVELIFSMASRLPEMQFLLVGGEPREVSRWKDVAISQGLPNIILTGFVSNTELPLFQAACDVLLMPYQKHVAASSGGDISRYLSPMKCFEYMASGRAILSSNLPVLLEALSGEIAMILPPDDLSAWISAVQALRQDPLRVAEMSEKARLHVRKFTWDARVALVLEGVQEQLFAIESRHG